MLWCTVALIRFIVLVYSVMAYLLPTTTPLAQLQVKNRIQLPIVERRIDAGRHCFIVSYQGEDYPVNMFEFQQSEANPTEVVCLVKGFQPNGRPIFAQDYTPLLKRFYEHGKEYEFMVTADSSHLPEGQAYYGIRDKYGFNFALYNFDRTRLSLRQIVRCVVRFQGSRLVASLVQDLNTRTTRILDEGVVARKLRSEAPDSLWDLEALVALVFSKESSEDYGGRMVHWLSHALTQFVGKTHREVFELLRELERCCLYLVENSDFFRDCVPAERQVYLMRLSAITEVVESFRKGQLLICNNEHIVFIDALLDKLDTAGYLYRAEEQLRMLSSLFALQPSLIPHNMAKLFSILRKGNTINWYTEPIRTAFLSLLEIYINNYRDRIDTLIVPDEEHPDGKISKVVQALAMQMLLSRPEDRERDRHIFDRDLNQALFYRALSYKPLVNTDILLEKSYQSLLGFFRETTPIYTWKEVHEMSQLATRAASQMPNTSDTEQQLNQMVTRYFDGSNTRLELTMQSIDLYPQRRGNTCAPALPLELLKWHQPQVHTNKHVSHNNLRSEDLMTYRQMWSDVVTAMEQVQLVSAEKPEKTIKVPPQRGDVVTIRIVEDQRGEGKTHHFAVEIVDDRFEGVGSIAMGNIVDYNAHATIDCFNAPDTGQPLLFEALVEDYDEEHEHYIFSMRNLIFKYLNEELNYDDEYHCFVTANPPQGLVVISEEGYSFCVPYTKGIPYCAPGDQILVRLNDKNLYANSTAYFVAFPDKKELGVTAAFHALMDAFAVGEYVPEVIAAAEEDENDNDKTTDLPLSVSYVQELTQLLDRVAVLRGDYVQAYNYLALARTLAQVINDSEREAYYNERMRLLELLKRFAIDGTVNTQELETFAQTSESLVSSYPELKKQFLRLQTVSFMGKKERNTDLWTTLGSDTKDTLLHNLARLVLTYNLLDASGMEREKLAVHDRIYDELRIDARKSDLKYFGDEGQTLEFKTTIVCPPDNNMRPDLPRQTHNIMRAIAGMLNAEGGKLLLGVNDQGMAVGLQSDLAYPQFGNNRDQYRVYIDNCINRHLGAVAGRCVRMAWEMPNGRPILVITIEPCHMPVELEGVVYERRGTSTRPLTENDLREFKQKRSHHVEALAAVGNTALADQLIKLSSVVNTVDVLPSETLGGTESMSLNSVVSAASAPLRSMATIATSQLRNNDVYDNGAEDFEEPIAVLNFYDADQSHKLTEGYADHEASLSLVIRESDRHQYLLLCYANDHCVRVPIDELLERKLNTPYKHYAEAPLKYASVIHSTDSFMSIRRDDKGRLFLRIDAADSVPVSAIRNATSPYLDLRGYTLETCEVLPAKFAPHFATYRRLVCSSLGVPISNKHNVVSEFAAHGIHVNV